MRGTDEATGSLFSYVDLEERIPAHHPHRKIRQVLNNAHAGLSADFDAVYVNFGLPLIARERLIRARLIQILFSIRSERQLMEQVQYILDVRRLRPWSGSRPSDGSLVAAKCWAWR